MLYDILHNPDRTIKGSVVVLVGTDGAVSGVLGPLLAQMPAKVYIVHRTLEKAQQLATTFLKAGPSEAISFDDRPKQTMDVIISGSSASVSGQLPLLADEIIAAQSAC